MKQKNQFIEEFIHAFTRTREFIHPDISVDDDGKQQRNDSKHRKTCMKNKMKRKKRKKRKR